MQLTANDIQNNLLFLNRVDIKGNEALPMAELQMKLQQIQRDLSVPPVVDDPELPPKEPAPPLKDVSDGKK